jgi:O-antigen/teichoic acid export membrane protein
LKKLFQSSFAKSVAMITGGTTIAQLLNALFSPIITRLYSPEEYGVLSVYTSILGLIVIIASLRYELGIPIAEDDEKAVNVMALCFFVLIIFVIVVFLIFLFFGEPILTFLDASSLVNYRYLIPIGVFLAGAYKILLQWAYRNNDFKSIANTKLAQSITGNGVKVGLGFLHVGPLGLIIGQILKEGAGLGTLSRSFSNNIHLVKKINKNDILWGAKRYQNFLIFSVPASFLNSVGSQLPVFFITSLYGSEILGFYGLSISIVNIPMNLIGSSIADVLYGEAVSVGRSNPKRIKYLSKKLFKSLLIIGLIPLLTLLFFGPFLFSFVFGSQWYEAGVYARILAFLVFTRFIFTPINRIYDAFERQKEALILDVFRVVLVFVSFLTAKFLGLSSYGAVILYSIVMSIVYFVTYLLAQRILNQEIKKKENV